MTPERVNGRVHLIAGADLIGFEEVRFACLAIATVLGTALGVGMRRLLEMVL